LPKTVTRQRRDCDLNPGPSAPEPSTLATRLPSHPVTACVCIQAYSSINEEQAMTSPSPPPAPAALPPAAAAAAGVGGGVARHSTPASSRWLRLRLHASATGAGGGRRLLPSALLAHRRPRPASTARDYSVDRLTDAVFHEFLRHDPQLDDRPPSRGSLDSSSDCSARQQAPRAGVWPPLTAHVEENDAEWVSGARRTLPNCPSVARNDTLTSTACRDSAPVSAISHISKAEAPEFRVMRYLKHTHTHTHTHTPV